MNYLEIRGGAALHGEVEVQGSKNAVLPILAACMLGTGECVIENCPAIGDVNDTLEILKTLGCRVVQSGRTVKIDASEAEKYEITATEAARIRSSVLFLGALLGRMKKAILPLPGGCAIGARPVDLHLRALTCLGAEFSGHDRIEAQVKRLRGGTVRLPMPSVGATENTILAAVAADGETYIENAAREPEIDELCEFLNGRGAHILRTARGGICISGGRPLGPVRYRMKADRIVTGTYLLAGAATGGKLKISNDSCEHLGALTELLCGMGVQLESRGGAAYLDAQAVREDGLRPVNYLETAPYPGFPTDLQSPLMAVLCRAKGESCICERVFENRFRTAGELAKMGADITTSGRCAVIRGVTQLHGARLRPPDLRGGAALVIAALQAKGCTVIEDTTYIDRGYEQIERDFGSLGADMIRYR